MQVKKLLFLVLIFCSGLSANDCNSCDTRPKCSTESTCNTSCNTSCNTNCKSSCESECVKECKSDLQDCFIKTCVFCKSCDIENRCCGNSGNFFGKTFFSIRPQDSNAARRILSSGTNGYDFRNTEESCFEDCNARAVVTLEYQQSFNDKKKLGQWFSFNCDDCNCMSVGVPGKGQTFDINAIELGITTTNARPGLLGEICLRPKIRNIIADLDFKFDLSDCLCNSWARVNMVVANCKTEMGIESNTTGTIGSTFPAGYFASSASEIPFTTVLEAFEAQSAVGELPIMKYGRFAHCKQSKTGVAGIHLDLGYDFVRCENGHVGASAHVVFPTGNRPKGEFIFEPIIGANKCWQLGATVNASYDLFKGCSNNRLTLFFDSVITHLFKSRQYRPFQLKNGPGSEFLILKEFDCNGDVIRLERAANILHGETRIGADIMFDGALMLQYSHCNFFGDLGYNFWYRSKEKRSATVCFRNFGGCNKFGIAKPPFCTPTTISVCSSDCQDCQPDNTTASKSGICKFAAADKETTFIQVSDIDFSAPLHPSVYSNKVFASIGYRFECKYPMYVSLGGEVEFGQDNRALNQWGVLGQFGISF